MTYAVAPTAEIERAYHWLEGHAPSPKYADVVRELRRCWRKFGKSTPPVVGVAERTGASPSTVKRATRWIRSVGMLTVVSRRPHVRDGAWHRTQTNLYVVHWPRRPRSELGVRPDPSMASRTVGTPLGVSLPDGARVSTTDPPRPPCIDAYGRDITAYMIWQDGEYVMPHLAR